MTSPCVTRRGFLQAGACVGGLLLSLRLSPANSTGPGTTTEAAFQPNAFITITRDGRVTLIVDKAEVGQGVYTSLPMLLAEELDVGLDQVTIEPAPPNDKLYADPLLQFQVTGNSTSVRGSWDRLRRAGATARTLLVSAAARKWNVDIAECRADNGKIVHGPTGRALSYGTLVDVAAGLPLPQQVGLKPASQFRLIGTSPQRLDLPGKVNGQATYGIDIRLPAMKFATFMACPVFGGSLGTVDDRAASSIPGVYKVVRLPDAVGVIADNTWAAMQGLAALQIEWNEGPHRRTTMRDIVSGLDTASQSKGVLAHQQGNAAEALRNAKTKLTAIYQMPFLAHAPMEPVTCVAHVHAGRCDIWTATQVQARAQAAAAKAAGIPLENVTIHNQLAGGAFGRRLEVDFIERAVQLAREVDMPVKMIWSREEDIRSDLYRPYYYDRLSAGLDEHGALKAWQHRITASSVMARFAPPALGPNGLDPDAVECAAQPIYDVPNHFVDFVRHEPPGIPTSFWRGVGPTHNVFVVESFVDECAAAAKRDPVDYRRTLLRNTPRALATLELAAQKAGWGNKLPARSGRGVAVVYVFDTYLCVVAQIAVSAPGRIHLERIVCAADCGTVVHPDNAAAQLEGGILFGLSAALYSEITVNKGRVVESNFHNYRTLRMHETPRMEVHFIPSHGAPGGLGETGTVGAAPALGNAIFAATGVRLRELPVVRHDLRQT
ncbi:MAG: aldehyde dehydrogenase [Gammaproteobacteria bacterium]|nr:aldehyde dehydrogenase [Gammaproteobacteria bacterium]